VFLVLKEKKPTSPTGSRRQQVAQVMGRSTLATCVNNWYMYQDCSDHAFSNQEKPARSGRWIRIIAHTTRTKLANATFFSTLTEFISAQIRRPLRDTGKVV